MKINSSNNNYVLKFDRGESLMEGIKNFCTENGIEGAFFYGLGAVQEIEIGYYDLQDQEYDFKLLDKVLEITNITGNVAMLDGELVVHAHANLSDRTLHTYGGHVKEAKVAGTCEIFLATHGALKRQKDSDTGLNLLDL